MMIIAPAAALSRSCCRTGMIDRTRARSERLRKLDDFRRVVDAACVDEVC